MAQRPVQLKVKRQDGPDRPETKRWEEFEVPYQPQMNVISALMEIQKHPDDRRRQEGRAGRVGVRLPRRGVRLVHDGHQRQGAPGVLGARRSDRAERRDDHPRADDQVPARARPHRRPQRMFEDLKRVKAWIHLDGTHELGPGPRESPEKQEERYPLSRCMTCGCCLEACPQYDRARRSSAPSRSTRCASSTRTPSGAMHEDERLER